MKKEKLDEILELHKEWLCDSSKGKRAYLRGAHLRGAHLSSADLSSADLRGADLCGAHLSSADLSSADLSSANLRGAHLSSADLSSADLRGADLCGAHLSSADLSSADLRGANLRGAHLRGARLPKTTYPEKGEFICFKKCVDNADNEYIVTLKVLKSYKRVGMIGSSKFRVSKAKVVNIESIGSNATLDKNIVVTGKGYKGIWYKVGKTVVPDSYDESNIIECSNGIHAFMTKEEAIAY